MQAALADERGSKHLMEIIDKLSSKQKNYGLPFQHLLADVDLAQEKIMPF